MHFFGLLTVFFICSCNRKMKPPFLKELYISSSLPNNSTLEESENQKTEIMKLNNDGSEDATYRV